MGKEPGEGEDRFVPFRRVGLPEPAPSDEILVAGCARGNVISMGQFFDRHSASVYRFLSRLSSLAPCDLDDMVNATFLQAFRGAGHFRGRSSVRSWLFGIAVNVGRHHIRDEARRHVFLKAWAEREQRAVPQPDSEVEQRQLLRRVEVALAGMSHNLRVAFILSDVEELSNTEAAAALGVPAGTLGRRLFEVHQALRNVLDEAAR